jgi:hypothetical protein
MRVSDLAAVQPLVGRRVQVQAVFGGSDPEVYDGLLLAIGTKQGQYANARPVCLVLDCLDNGGGVPIIAIRSVTSINDSTGKPIWPST